VARQTQRLLKTHDALSTSPTPHLQLYATGYPSACKPPQAIGCS